MSLILSVEFYHTYALVPKENVALTKFSSRIQLELCFIDCVAQKQEERRSYGNISNFQASGLKFTIFARDKNFESKKY